MFSVKFRRNRDLTGSRLETVVKSFITWRSPHYHTPFSLALYLHGSLLTLNDYALKHGECWGSKTGEVRGTGLFFLLLLLPSLSSSCNKKKKASPTLRSACSIQRLDKRDYPQHGNKAGIHTHREKRVVCTYRKTYIYTTEMDRNQKTSLIKKLAKRGEGGAQMER